ncbi:glycosyltransferase family 4 protein [Halomonas getboli]|uniref:glycosyltransferase family 4 protein n=1 Tax=Halomonas getboli TaxID=2935862 RepID=UPI001FFF9C88|nr:glycosyltransferase family 4 protein [Halomonas getboli]MCK2183058.1 glycosyltransferase family 4 protein [Halomonas getboli]
MSSSLSSLVSVPSAPLDVLIVAGNARSLIANRGDLIRDIQARGHTVAAAVPTADMLPGVQALGIPVFPLPMARAALSPRRDLATLLALWRLMRRLQPRAVLGYTAKPVIYGGLAARLAGVPRCHALITGLGHAFAEPRGWRDRGLTATVAALYRLGLAGQHGVFFQNPDDRAEFDARGLIGRRTRATCVDGSGINLEAFPACPIPEGPPLLLYVGRLLRDKGVAEFVAAAARLKAEWPEARFVAVGPHDASLPHACAAEDVVRWRREGIVEFVGGVDDVRPWLAACHAFVFPSRYREGVPRCVLEALATGRAVITTDAPGCRETVRDGGNGLLVPPGDIEALADAMGVLLAQPALLARMGRASRALAVERFDVCRVNRMMLEAMGL